LGRAFMPVMRDAGSDYTKTDGRITADDLWIGSMFSAIFYQG